jgi:hypothetical protein
MSKHHIPKILIGSNTNKVQVSSREERRARERAEKKALKKGGKKVLRNELI